MTSKLLASLILALFTKSALSAPNVVFVLVDDVGWADFGYNTDGLSLIPTPNIDALANQGLKLKNHYVHTTCTPSRASLMTGKYAANVGLPCAMAPGSVAGLPDGIATMPQMLRKAGYSAHMVGKWHVGHSQWKQIPVGKGFESHVGGFMWSLESYTKMMWRDVVTPVNVDWGKYYENGTYHHFAEDRHATVAITDEAVMRMEEHDKQKPLFLYVSYNAAHTPLQPEHEWLQKCQHLPHSWRRSYCGLVVGLDLAVKKLVDGAKQHLGEDTVFVVTSDNGGPTWFGGLNAPYRGTKFTPFEGGAKVPGFVLDMSGNYTMGDGAEMNHMMHISDWMPTFLSWAGAKDSYKDLSLDGMDQTRALKKDKKVRDEVLIELFTEKESHDKTYSAGYRKGNYKFIQGNIKDPNWYSEPTVDNLQTDSTDKSWLSYVIEKLIKVLEDMFGSGPIDLIGDLLVTHIVYYNYMLNQKGMDDVMLFDLEKDPEERNNIAKSNPKIVEEFQRKLDTLKAKRPKHPRYWYVSKPWVDGAGKVEGNCPEGSILHAKNYCKFAHPWIPDSVDVLDEDNLELIPGVQWWVTSVVKETWYIFVTPILATALAAYFLCSKCRNN